MRGRRPGKTGGVFAGIRNTLRIFSGRERRRWSRIVHRSRKVNVGQAPKTFKGASHEWHLRLPSRLRKNHVARETGGKSETREKRAIRSSKFRVRSSKNLDPEPPPVPPFQLAVHRSHVSPYISVPARATASIRNRCLAPSPYSRSHRSLHRHQHKARKGF